MEHRAAHPAQRPARALTVLMEVSQTRVTDPTAGIAAWLREESHAGDVRILRHERLRGGAIQDNVRIDVAIVGGPWNGEHAFVLRSDAPSRVAASLTRAREYAVLCVAHAAGVLVPTPRFLCTDPGVLGREFFLMDYVPGVAAGHRLTREAALVPDAAGLAHALGANLARIHAIRPPCAQLDASPTQRAPAGTKGRGDAVAEGRAAPSTSPALDTIAVYRDWLDRFDDAYPALEWGLRWCELNAPSPCDVTLVHRDYRTGNYLVADGMLKAVLDWEFAGFGDPREDLGWFTARCWRFAAPEREAGGIAPLEAFLDGYASITARRISRSELDYWQAMAHNRWAIIALQQARRHRTERSLELAMTGRIVHELEYEVLRLIGTSLR
jgi:aminoglycoside phosphotransferase (APT) family kinase protein